jgi:hypothetical protein
LQRISTIILAVVAFAAAGCDGEAPPAPLGTSPGDDARTVRPIEAPENAAPPAGGMPGAEFVSAGGVVRSERYQLVFTLGQPSLNQGSASSPDHSMRGGFIGATGEE